MALFRCGGDSFSPNPRTLTTSITSSSTSYSFTIACNVGDIVFCQFRNNDPTNTITNANITGADTLLKYPSSGADVCFIAKATSSTITVNGAKNSVSTLVIHAMAL